MRNIEGVRPPGLNRLLLPLTEDIISICRMERRRMRLCKMLSSKPPGSCRG